MPIPSLEYRAASSTVRFPWDAQDETGAPVTATFTTAHIKVYKDGSATERASTSGFTATVDFDSKTGAHLAILDLSDNADAGFYAAGSEYWVLLDGATVNGIAIRQWLGRFVIGSDNPAIASYIDTEVAAIKAKTDNLPASPAATSDIPSAATIAAAAAAQVTTDHGSGSYLRNTEPLDAAATRTAVGLTSANLDTQLGAIAGYIDTEVGAIKAKTDNLPASPAATGDIPSAATIAAAVRDVSNSSPAAGSFGEAARNADAKAAVLIDTIGTPVGSTVSEDIGNLPTAAQNADALLARNNKGGANGGLTVARALQFGFNRTVFNDDSTFDVYDDDGTTILWSGTYTREAVDAVVSVTPG